MNKTLAIVGAGPGMGLAIAKTFGAQGFSIALLSKSPVTLELLVGELAKQGIEAAAFTADVLDHHSIAAGLDAAKKRFGRIDVLEVSPLSPSMQLLPVLDVKPENVQPFLDFTLHGAIAATNHVLPDMLERGSGTILFTTGASSVYPAVSHDKFANYTIAAGGLRSYAYALHAAVAEKGVQVGHVAIAVFIGQQAGGTPGAIAPLFWELHTKRDEVEKVFMLEGGLP
jgi:NAD(P)-dependent dehydrogenase (short-subunit alcohol dehydrogenase family)